MEYQMVVQPKLITVDEFEHYIAQSENRDRLFELINGEIVEKVPTEPHGIVTGTTYRILDEFLDDHPIGRVTVETRYRPTDDQYNNRIPDVSFVAGNKPLQWEGAVNYLPDLCVEIQSPDDSPKEMLEKALFYLEHGARMVWLIYPKQRIVEFMTAKERLLLTEDDTISGGDVLPGFEISVKEFFRRL